MTGGKLGSHQLGQFKLGDSVFGVTSVLTLLGVVCTGRIGRGWKGAAGGPELGGIALPVSGVIEEEDEE